MSVRKIHGSWWVDFRHEYTRYRKKSPENTRAGALAYEAVLRAKLAQGVTLARPPVSPTLEDFTKQWLATYVAPNNKPSERSKKERTFALHILPCLGGIRLSELGVRHVEHYKAQKLAEGLKAKTVNNHLTMLHRCLRSAVEWGELAQAPKIQWLKAMRPVVRFLADGEADQLLNAGRGPFKGMLVVALRTGLRIGELLGLMWEDVRLDEGLIVVQRSIVDGVVGVPKNHRSRVVPFGDELRCAFAMLSEGKSRCVGRIFLNETATPITRSQANERLYAACVRAGLPRFGWHTLRHTFATQLVARGAPLRAVQELLGHATITMTERYAHVAPSSLRAAVDLLARGQPVGNSARFPALEHPRSTANTAEFAAARSERDIASAMSLSW